MRDLFSERQRRAFFGLPGLIFQPRN